MDVRGRREAKAAKSRVVVCLSHSSGSRVRVRKIQQLGEAESNIIATRGVQSWSSERSKVRPEEDPGLRTGPGTGKHLIGMWAIAASGSEQFKTKESEQGHFQLGVGVIQKQRRARSRTWEARAEFWVSTRTTQ